MGGWLSTWGVSYLFDFDCLKRFFSEFIKSSEKARKMAKIKKNSKTKNRKLQGTPVGKAKYNQKNKVVSKIKKKALGTKIKKAKFDARNVLHAKSRKEMLATDARNKLAKIAKGVDARQKLEKIKNLKEGKFDVKKTKKRWNHNRYYYKGS